MSSDLISREDAKFLVKQTAKQIAKQNGVDDTTYALKIVYDDMDTIPAVDVAPVVHGRWKYRPPYESLAGSYLCSACGYLTFTQSVYGYNYCPNCGAKMGGDPHADGA